MTDSNHRYQVTLADQGLPKRIRDETIVWFYKDVVVLFGNKCWIKSVLVRYNSG